MSTMNIESGFRGIDKLTKQVIRSKILLRLKTQKEEDRDRKSNLVKKKLFSTNVFKKAKKVMFFVSFGGEINTEDMIKEARILGKTIAVPVCGKNGAMKPCVFTDKTRFISGLFGIKEPAIKKFIKLKDLDVVVVPGVAFDKKGNRLGRGKGYYDRFLEKLSPKTVSIGLAYDFQILPSVPADSYDKKLNKVIFA